MSFRHVVMFRWTTESTTEQRASAIEALRRFGEEISDLGRLVVGEDAGLAQGNADAVVTVDFSGPSGYTVYATDPRHLRLLDEHIRPILRDRWAVQHEL